MLWRSIILGVLLLSPIIASPEIEKVGQVCDKGICFVWWPKLDPAKGWHHDDGASWAVGANVQVPDGFAFPNAETVIYAKASYKPRIPETTSLEILIRNDRDDFLKHDPGVTITKVPSLKTKDGKALETYTFFPTTKGNWEEVSYGEEGDFYLIFTISSRSRAGYLSTLPVFEQYIDEYKE
jgi:hypothetical protein